MPQLREKPHQGFETRKRAWNTGHNVCNFTVTLGLRATVVENGVRETYSARYYNPNTGRFMSRDPEDGYAKDPASLHKYLYAGGDPINAKDPTGRAILFGTGAIDRSFLLETVPAVVGFVGGTTIAIANFMDAIATGIAEIALDLSEAALDYAMGMFDTAFGLFEEAIDTYDILLHQTGFWGGVTRFLTCDILGTEFAVIAEHVFNAPKAAVLIEKGTQMVCAGLADMKVVHP